jgi:hypothetical protein
VHPQGVTGAGSSHHHVISAVAVANTFIKDFSVSQATSATAKHRHQMNATSSSTPDLHHHIQGPTGGGGAHQHEVTGTVGNVVSDVSHTHNLAGGLTDYVYISGDFKHGHVIPDSDTAGGEARGIVSEGTHNLHVVATEPGETVSVQYGIHEIAAGTTLELLVNSEVVASNYVGAQTDIRIDGYLSTGNNTVEIRPIVGENGKKGSCTVLATGVFFVEAKK